MEQRDNFNVSTLNGKYVLLFAWLALTFLNIGKAYHIDDTFHLEAAAQIAKDPMRPMSGLVNWDQDPEPLYKFNQPPLFFYLIALYGAVFGTSEIAMHLLLSVFTFLALFFFQKSTQLLSLKSPNTLLLLFAFCPALVVNQNLMTDVPILSAILAIFYFVIKASSTQSKLASYTWACSILSAGLLVKYSLLPLVPLLLLVMLIRRDFKHLATLIIPLFVLSAWSFWNYMEYSGIHLLDRPKSTSQQGQALTFMACVGSVGTMGLSILAGLLPRRGLKPIMLLIPICFFCVIFGFAHDTFSEYEAAQWLNRLFLLCGLLIGLCLITILIIEIVRQKKGYFLYSPNFIVLLFLGALSAFIILYAPFMATRHVLLVVPFIILFAHEQIHQAGRFFNGLSIALTCFLGLALGISDWVYADYYRHMAKEITLNPKGANWSAGHWGWQWYTTKRGARPFGLMTSVVRNGDYRIYPGNISKQTMFDNMELLNTRKYWEEPTVLSFFSVSNFASMYCSFHDKGPWSLSKRTLDTIYVSEMRLKFKPDSLGNNTTK